MKRQVERWVWVCLLMVASCPACGDDAGADETRSPTASAGETSGTPAGATTNASSSDMEGVDAPGSSSAGSAAASPDGSASSPTGEVDTGAGVDTGAEVDEPAAAVEQVIEGEANAGQAPPPLMPGSGEAMSIEEFCSRRAHLDDVWCEYRDRCCTPEDVESGVFWLPGCLVQDLAEEACLEELDEALADGLTYDGTWAEQCLEALGQLGYKPPDGCAGTLGDDSYESNHTDPLMWELTACEYMLTANVGEGLPCNNVRACAPGLGCGPSTNSSGDEFLCHTPGGIGAPCYSVNECEIGLVCYPFLEDGLCQPPMSEGGPCLTESDCEDGNMCHLDYCAPTLDLGQSCPNFTFCLSKLQCNFLTATCDALLPAGEGPCSSDYDCEGRCDSATNTCTTICGGTR